MPSQCRPAHLMKSAPAPVEQHRQQGQRASRAGCDVKESGLRQRLHEPWTFAGYRAQFDIEALLSQVAERGPLSSGPSYADGCPWRKELADIRGVLIVG